MTSCITLCVNNQVTQISLNHLIRKIITVVGIVCDVINNMNLFFSK